MKMRPQLETYVQQHYYYTVFGLNLRSVIRCEELTPLENPAPDEYDVSVAESDSLAACFPVLRPEQWFEIRETTLWFKITGVGLFKVSAGTSIIFQRDPSLDPGTVEDRDIAIFLLGSCLGAILQQRDVLTLHASCAVIDKTAVCFVGESGAGKSTTLASLTQNGHTMLSDDVCALDIINDSHCVRPAYAQIKLNPDSAASLGLNLDNLDSINRFKSKFALRNELKLASEPQPLSSVFCIEVCADKDEIQFVELQGMESFAELHKNIYRPQFLTGFGKLAQTSSRVAAVANSCSVFKIYRPAHLQLNHHSFLSKIYESMGI